MTTGSQIATQGYGTRIYKYSAEIKQMMFVFGELKDPDDLTVRYIEDIVRGQVAELIVQARSLAFRRNSKTLSAEDLMFLIRHDRAKVARLRTYLGWKDVRKRAKDTEGGANDAADIDEVTDEAAVAVAASTQVPNSNATTGAAAAGRSVTVNTPGSGASVQKMKMKISWDLIGMYSEFLPENDEEEDEDEMQAYEDSKRRLKNADDLTRAMTREEYSQYSEARQASFTWRKGKRFRDFINFSAFVEGNPNDEVVDILGFLAYEMVRTLCEKGFQVQASRLQKELKPRQQQKQRRDPKKLRDKRKKKPQNNKKALSVSPNGKRRRTRSSIENGDVKSENLKRESDADADGENDTMDTDAQVENSSNKSTDPIAMKKADNENHAGSSDVDSDDDSSGEDGHLPTGPFSAPIYSPNDLYSSTMTSQRRLQLLSHSTSSTNAAQNNTIAGNKDAEILDHQNGIASAAEEALTNANNIPPHVLIPRQPLTVRDIDIAFEEVKNSNCDSMRMLRNFSNTGPFSRRVGLL